MMEIPLRYYAVPAGILIIWLLVQTFKALKSPDTLDQQELITKAVEEATKTMGLNSHSSGGDEHIERGTPPVVEQDNTPAFIKKEREVVDKTNIHSAFPDINLREDYNENFHLMHKVESRKAKSDGRNAPAGPIQIEKGSELDTSLPLTP